MKKTLIIMLLTVIFVESCSYGLPSSMDVSEAVIGPTVVAADQTPIPLPTSSPTVEPSPTNTQTPLPTIVKHPPTPTQEHGVEWDLDPFFEKKVDVLWGGVRIKASLVIDKSLADKIESVEIPGHIFANIVARSLFVTWYARKYGWQGWPREYQLPVRNEMGRLDYYLVKNGDQIPAEEYSKFLALWAKAQETGKEQDWRKVQIYNIWANDLTDNEGFVQRQYSIYPMYDGEAPYGVTGINYVTIVFVDPSRVTNINRYLHSKETESHGFGTNIDDGNLIIYLGYNFNPEISVESEFQPKSVWLFQFVELVSSIGIRLTMGKYHFTTEWAYLDKTRDEYTGKYNGDNYFYGITNDIEVKFVPQ